MALEQIRVRGIPPERLEALIGPERTTTFVTAAADARTMLEGRVVWNLNSTATGGGVAELLQRHSVLSLSSAGNFNGIGYAGTRDGAIRFSMTLERVRAGTVETRVQGRAS